MDRQVSRLARQVPERHIDRGESPDLGTGAGKTGIGMHLAIQLGDSGRILSQYQGSDPLVQIGLDRAAAEVGLAKPDQPLVRMDKNPDQAWPAFQAEAFQLGDLHAPRSRLSPLLQEG